MRRHLPLRKASLCWRPLIGLRYAGSEATAQTQSRLRQSLELIRKHDDSINAYLHIYENEERTAFSGGPLDDLLISIKDNICTADAPTTASSVILQNHRPKYDATVVTLLRQSGATIVGKTNLDEFGMGSHGLFSRTAPTIHPMSILGPKASPLRYIGGSSSGSAASVHRLYPTADVSIGTDTGGSIRLPASYGGLYGFKPSYGTLSRWGVVQYASSLDTVGLLAREIGALTRVWKTLACYDAKDPTAAPAWIRRGIEVYRQHLQTRPPVDRPLRIGIPVEYFPAGVSEGAIEAVRKILTLMKASHPSIEWKSISLPSSRHALSAYYVLASAEASSNLARYDGLRNGSVAPKADTAQSPVKARLYSEVREHGFGPEVKRRILLGTHALTSDAYQNYFLQAQKVRAMVRDEFDQVFAMANPLRLERYKRKQGGDLRSSDRWLHADDDEATFVEDMLGNEYDNGVDFIVTPASIDVAPIVTEQQGKDASSAANACVNDLFMVPASLAGLPALVVPTVEKAAEESGQWPIGVQIIGQWGNDVRLLHLAEQLSHA